MVAVITSFVTYKGIWSKAKADLENEYKKRLNDKRWAIYIRYPKYIKQMIDVIRAEFNPGDLGDKRIDLHEMLDDIAVEIILIASDDVIKGFSYWRVLEQENGLTDNGTIKSMMNLLQDMRKDLGFSDTKIDTDDVLSALVPGYQRTLP